MLMKIVLIQKRHVLTFLSITSGWGKISLCTEDTVAANMMTCCVDVLS